MMKLKERYFIKIVPQRGETVHRFEISRRHIVTAAVVALVALLGTLGFAALQIAGARARVAQLQRVAAAQRAQLGTIDKKAAQIRKELRAVQKQNVEIQQLIGVRPKLQKTAEARTSRGTGLSYASRRVEVLEADSRTTVAESNLLRRLAMHVLNVRHIQELERARALAEIPSLNPVDGTITGCYCYRTSPDVEFHEGVDLSAPYGDAVHAAAAGTVTSAGWDGGYGIKIVVDHGNGYQTWYAHLSRVAVTPGTYVHKGETIGYVGSTGFSTGPHLHYQVMLDGSAVNPTPYLDGVPAKVLASLP